MKIALGYVLQEGPYGGGNSVIISMAHLLAEAGHEVVWSLADANIDIVVLVDPRVRSPNISFGAGAIARYLLFRNPNAIVVQQIHDCDERKNTRFMNRRQRIANYVADATVCVGSWMLDLDLVRQEHRSRYVSVLNGGRTEIFHAEGHVPWDGNGPLRLVTHHWGGHWMKGFDVYSLLDQQLADPEWRDKIDFTYIGNVPSGFRFEHATHLPPLSGEALADELRRHHAYITASINEPAGLHHVEGALCGLPIVYRNSGGLPEYCDGYGVIFEGMDDVLPAIDRMRGEYDKWREQLTGYVHTERRMVEGHIELFVRLLGEREEIVSARRLWRNPLLLALNQIPF